MDGVKTLVRACISNGEQGRMMLRVPLCGGGKRGEVLSPYEPSGEVAGGGFLKAIPLPLLYVVAQFWR